MKLSYSGFSALPRVGAAAASTFVTTGARGPVHHSKISARADDVAITARVSAGLAADKDLSAIKIDIETQQGVVTLSGPAPTDQAKRHAGDIASHVKGVALVRNQLVVPG